MDLRIEDHPNHWRTTLLGAEFWKDVEIFIKALEAEHDQAPLHTTILFDPNQQRNTNPSQTENNKQSSIKPRRRRFSMDDAGSRSDRFLNWSFGRRGRSSSRASEARMTVNASTSTSAVMPGRGRGRSRGRERNRSPSVAPETRRSRSLLRLSFNMRSVTSFRSSSRASRKRDDDGGNVDVESILSTTNRDSVSVSVPVSGQGPVVHEQGTPDKPLMYFRGGASWNCLSRDMQEIGLDLFWPVKLNHHSLDLNQGHNSNSKKNSQTNHHGSDSDLTKEVLPLIELAPLSQFRHLRVLKITGMLQSYQKYIWQAAWLNPELEELELGMAIGPRIRRTWAGDWPCIKGGWRLREDTYGEPVYYGNNGTGTLNRSIGVGEYLDKTAIEKAKILALATPTYNTSSSPSSSTIYTRTRVTPRLPIKTLTLTGFVVDADPFLLWFDPKRLQHIHFRDECVDAGFWLCLAMRRAGVRVGFPREVGERVVEGRVVDMQREGRVVDVGRRPPRRGKAKPEPQAFSGFADDGKDKDVSIPIIQISDVASHSELNSNLDSDSDPASDTDAASTQAEDGDVNSITHSLKDKDSYVYDYEMF